MIPHRALATFTEAAAHLHRITPGDRVLQFAAWSFDTSAEEIYPTLTRGATLVLKPEGPAAAAELAAFAASRALTVLDLPTAYWHRLLGAPAGLALPPGVRRVILGGEAVSPRALAAWHRQDPPAPGLVNTYGPTEATVVATAAELGRRERASSGRVAIGRPLPGTRTHLVDRRLRPVPPGVAGELLLGGPSLARGYRGRPATTAASFVPDPFSGLPGARLYRTGDLARHRPGGALEFVGRTDEQVKVRGFRIEPGEIAAALARHPGVGEAAVVARRMGGDGPGGGGEHDVRLVAYVVPATGGPAAAPAAGELRRFLQERLPEHMVPAFFVPLDALPLTRHGKLDRRALPAPQAPRPAGAAEIATPRNDTERALVRLWREVLGVERVGVRDNFFELGGDSLLLLRVHEGLAAELGVEISVLELFRYPTVETLAARLGAGEAQGRSLSEVGSEAALRADRAASRRRQLRRRQPPPRPARRPGSGR